MSRAVRTLKAAPIVEAVLDFECDFAPGQSQAGLEKPVMEKLRDHYPKLRKDFVEQSTIEFGATSPLPSDGGAPTLNLAVLKFLHDDDRQLVQLRPKGYWFNRLAPYSSFDEYLPEIKGHVIFIVIDLL